MAIERALRCDVCSQIGDDVRTYTVRMDGHVWEVELDDEHAKPLLEIVAKGRVSEAGLRSADSQASSLERRIRNRPPSE